MAARFHNLHPASILACSLVIAALFPAGAQTRTITGGGSVSDAGIRVKPPGPPVVIKETALTPLRAWKNTDGKVITAYLLAHRIPGQETSRGDTPVVVVLDGKVRLHKDKKTFLFPLENLSREDQNYIQELVFAIQEREEQEKDAE